MSEILKKAFEINLNDYENINFNLEINKVVLGASIALIIGIILFNTYRAKIRLLVMQLIRHEAYSEESGKTLMELRIDKTFVLKYLLNGNNILTKIVARVGEKHFTYEEYVALSKEERAKAELIDFETAAFYIRDDKKEFALSVVDKYNTSLTKTILAIVFVISMCVCVVFCMPGILNVISNLLKQ